ncbi:hypothetical protein RIF29_23751 [Crotalaria pallida]|uniref:Alpha/beta hydrolase fold-3 domain-containing protein n=1 Tax=Crotalaria pallida TaxID=3830 RepID=A0AAN9IB57_CROPI
MDPYKSLNIILNPNNTLTRLNEAPQIPPSPNPTSFPNIPVLFKDLTIDPSKPTWTRIYLPLHHSHHHKLPIIVFFHGGGFIFDSAASPYHHNFCAKVSNFTNSVVVSIDYRLAPEHRLPAAYDDSVEALHWIKATNDLWLTRHADYSRCYLMGESAGGNIVYNVGLRAAAEFDHHDHIHVRPLKITSLVMIHPFFGGTKRTASELRLEQNTTLPVAITDMLWNLSLPVGANRDHKYSNPMIHGGSKGLDRMRELGWRVAVFGSYGDPLVDHQRQFVNFLKGKGVHVVAQFSPGGRHGIFIENPSLANKVYDFIRSLH